jgi:hypothetical protein
MQVETGRCEIGNFRRVVAGKYSFFSTPLFFLVEGNLFLDGGYPGLGAGLQVKTVPREAGRQL